jgi:hypothetical protein
MLEIMEIHPVRPWRSDIAIGQQPIAPPKHDITMLRYGNVSATIALYRLTADSMEKLQQHLNSPCLVHFRECVGCQTIKDSRSPDAFFMCIGRQPIPDIKITNPQNLLSTGSQY